MTLPCRGGLTTTAMRSRLLLRLKRGLALSGASRASGGGLPLSNQRPFALGGTVAESETLVWQPVIRASMVITFVLPGRNRSGGCRVTVDMANELLARGHRVRIAYRAAPGFGANGWKQEIRDLPDHFCRLARRAVGTLNDDWIQDFKGVAKPFKQLDDIEFEAGEIVIGVGSFVADDLRQLRADVVKVRYCHGFQEHDLPWTKQVWSGSLPTIAVSRAFVPRLEEFSGRRVCGVVPNGVKETEYFRENVDRNGIGTIYGTHVAKAPEFTIEALNLLAKCSPSVPQYVFGTSPRPQALRAASYTRSPSIQESRSVYNNCGVWLLCSSYESFSVPILEAWLCGCAVVSTKNLGALELIEHGTNGLLVPIGDRDSMVRAVATLLEDDPLRARMAAAGRAKARSFTWSAAADRMEEVLQQIVAGSDYLTATQEAR